MITNNAYLLTNKRKIDNIIYHCESYRASGSYGGQLNLFDIIYTLKALVQEVEKLQKEIDSFPKSKEKVQGEPKE